MRYFDDFAVGERHDIPATYEMTKDEIVSFARKWDPQPFHVDEAAAANSIYGTLTACGTHIQAVVLFLAARLPEETAVIGALGYDEVRFHKAAKLGDTPASSSNALRRNRPPRSPTAASSRTATS